MRARIEGDFIYVDDIIVGQGCNCCDQCHKEGIALINELNASDDKCDIVKEMFIWLGGS